MSFMSPVPTLDGYQIPGVPADQGCCPPSLCNINYCDFICSFMAYMPSGPLWDFWKRFRADQMREYGDICGMPGCEEIPACLTIIDHAIYTAKKLLAILQDPLQTSIWESNPLTAFITREYWLSSFGWEDCFQGPSTNAELGFPTPYQAVCNKLLPQSLCAFDTTLYQMTGTGGGNPNPIVNIEALVKAACPAPLVLATQYAILIALKRMQLGVIRNIEGINFILAPLGCAISLVMPDQTDCPPREQCVMVNDCNQMTGSADCAPYQPCINVVLQNLGDTINGGPGITEPYTCENFNQAKIPIAASYHFEGVVMPTTEYCPDGTIAGEAQIWPALMAASCILISLLPIYLNYTLIVQTT